MVRVQTEAGASVFPPQEMEQDLYQDNTGQYSWHRKRDRHRSDKSGKEEKTRDCRGIEREELFSSKCRPREPHELESTRRSIPSFYDQTLWNRSALQQFTKLAAASGELMPESYGPNSTTCVRRGSNP